jgi:hypothetical protein
MKSFFVKTLSLIIALGFSLHTYADTRIEQVWSCTIKDGKSIADIKALNSKWVKYANKAVKGGDIQSYVVTAIVGEMEGFIFVDSFPSMESWTAKEAAMSIGEGKKLVAAFNKIGKCKSNSLYSVEES